MLPCVVASRHEPVGEQNTEERDEERAEQQQELLILREVEKRTGKPAAFIETDLVDPRYFSAANVKNRLESYFQMIKAKRAALTGVH